MATGLNTNAGATFETWINFSQIAPENGIFASCDPAYGSERCKTWFQAVSLVWSNTGSLRVQPSGAAQSPSLCTVNGSTPKIAGPTVNFWHHVALSIPSFQENEYKESLIFIDGKLAGRCNFKMTNVLVKTLVIGGSGSGTNRINIGPTRLSKTQRYTAEFTPGQTFPTAGDSNSWAVLNTPYDSDNPNACLALSDANNKTLTFGTFASYDLINSNTAAGEGGGTGNATVTCSSSAPPVPAPNFSYSNSTINATRGTAITSRTASSTGGTIDSYAVQPTLPAGLLLNPTTGEISGTPSAPSNTAIYAVTATQNGTGATKTVNVTITVTNPATTLVISDLANAAQVGRVETLTATANPVAGVVAFSTDQGPIPGCESVPTSTSAPFVAQCPWNPTSAYYILSASFTPTDSANYLSSIAQTKTNIRGSLSLTSTGPTSYPGGGQGLGTNNTLRLNFPSGTGLITAQSFTIETWVKVNSTVLNMDINAFYGDSFYGDRGQGISIGGNSTSIYNFLSNSVVGLITPTVPISASSTWQNIVYQRNYVQGSASQSYDAVFVNGVLVAQFANGGYMVSYNPNSTDKSNGVRIGPFNGEALIGPTQVLSGVAAYPLTGFSPSTTYSFGSNTLALFQPSPTACTSAAVSPLSITASHGASTSACSGDFPRALPYVTSVVSNKGPLAGGNVVTVSGNNFLNVEGVKFGTLSATNWTPNAFGTALTATVPESVSLGDVSVTVTTSAGTSPITTNATYTYLPLPTITGLSPTGGSPTGGSGVVITGTNFTNASAVTFGSNNATSFTVNSSTQITASYPGGSGTVNVRVTTPGGTSQDVSADDFTYTSATSVTAISPNTGSTNGGTVVEISGTNFSSSSTVAFGSNAATNVSYNSTTGKLTATSPAGTGTVSIFVTTGDLTSLNVPADDFAYTANVEVSAISRAFGPTTGGTVVEISGTNFTSASTVAFGSNAATDVSYNSTTGKLTATSPAGTGTVNVRVTTGTSPQSATATANQFVYYAPPTVTGLSRSTGPNGGASSVVITGTNFTSASTVAFGSNNVATFTIDSTTQITATSPAGTGAVDVRVSNQGGTSENVDADNFTYFPVPVVTSISPSTGTTAGGTSVTITGENFTSVTGVKFGTADGTSVTVVSATQITVVAPAGTGDANVTVINPGGTSTVALYGKYTYVSVPTITSISPTSGMLTGGQEVIIEGTGLDNLLTTDGVLFGSIAAQSVTVNSSTQIRVISPATTTLGEIDIFVVNASGSSVASTASKFTYTKSNDAKLSALTLSQATLAGGFSPTNTSYTSSVINSVDKVTVTSTINQANATVQVKIGSGAFETVASGSASSELPLVVGANTISVKVTAHDESTTNIYTITLTRLSNVATLSSASVKSQTSTLGTPNGTLGSETPGEITLTTAQATGNAATTFTTTDSGATVTKIAKFATGTTENLTNFDAATSVSNGATGTVLNGDFFVVKVTAADGTVNYSRFNVTVNSDVASLSGALIKGQSATVGTAGASLGSLSAGTITLTTAQATGDAATTFTKTDSGSTITKIAKLASGTAESSANFNAAAAFTNSSTDTVLNGDYFIIQVTAADATVRFYRITVTVNSNVATLSGATIKAQTSILGTPNTVLAAAEAGTITLTTAQATGAAATTFTRTDVGSVITKIVKYASGAPTSNFEIDTAFANSATSTVANGDFFIVKVTAQDGTVNYSRFNVTVNSNVATLSAVSIKGQSATVGTAGTALGSLTASAITLTTAQAIGNSLTTFTKTDAGAVITKIAKLASGADENSTNFNAATAFASGSADTISSGDYFIIQVTAADATVSFYRFNVTVNSNVATLSTTLIKGLSPSLGTPNATLGSETPGAITLTTAQATGTAPTTFTKSDAGATISRIVKYGAGASTSNFEIDTAFSNSATVTVANDDFFIIKVTAADGTVNHYRFNVTVNSDVATLSSALIKGQSATIGTAGTALGSLTAGAVTLTTAQATGDLSTTFTKTDGGATVSKIVKLASSADENSTNFNAATALTDGSTVTVSTGDYFIIQVTSADATVNFYRFNVTVNSNVATLSGATIKGLTGTLGTAGAALGSLTAGSVILSVSQANGTELTTFTKSDSGSTITKIAKLASGTAESQANFDAAAAFTNGSAATVSNGDYFIIQVTAADGTVNYSRVNLVFATSPTVPLSLSATAQGGGANLSWNAPSSNGGSTLTGYVIEASTDSSTWTEVGTTNATTRQLSVTSLLNGTSYVYRVRATNSSGDLNFNWATSASVRSFYRVICSIEGSFYVNSTLSVVQIPSAAGINCKGEVTIPQGIVQINSNAFTFNTETTNRSITKITFPATGLRTIDQGALKNLGLTTVTIPGTVETVGIYSFMNNYITTAFVTGTGPANHPTALLDSAFKGNPGIALTLGSGKIEIGEVFGTGTSFSSVDWGTGLKSIGRRAFYNVAAGTWAPLFPATITAFDAQAFEGTGIKTIRFGSATTHAVTSIATSAFDPSITSVQYCGQTGTLLSNYINSRFTSKTIWCAEVVPNSPVNVTAVAGTSGQVVLNWGKGAGRNEAPTDGFDIRYSSDGGTTWSSLVQASGSATSYTVQNLVNGTSYVFQIRAKNLFGESSYSSNASATPLGDRNNPQFSAATSTAVGFTVNVINYDPTYTYSVPQVTQGSGTVSVGTATGNTLPITVTEMSPGSAATISIGNQKQGFTSGSGLVSGSALNAAKVPVIGSVVRLTGGFTAVVTNYDSAYTWNVVSTAGTAVINTQGGITVSGVAPSTTVDLTVSTSRNTYAPGSTLTTVSTLALLKVIYNGTSSTGGAVPTDANSYASNSSATVLANPASGGLTLSGYDFAGWSLNSDESGQIYQSGATVALGLVDVTLYAKWSLTQYSVSYNGNGATGGSVPLDSNTYTMGGSVPILGNTGTLVRTGYSFIGWGISSTDTVNQYVSGNTFTAGTNNIAFWARWSPNTYRVTFDANGGSGSPSKAYDDYTTAGTAIALATRGTLAKSGYDFAGWGLSAVSTPVADPFTTTANIDLYAQWTVANFAVTYLAGTYGSGTVPTQANVNYGTSFTAAASTGLTGSDATNTYEFVSWSDGTRTYAPGQSILMGAGAITLTAQWTRVYNVKYSFNGGSVSTPIADQPKIAGQSITVSSVVPTRDGYEFATWKDQSGEEATAGANYVVRDSHYLLYAQWTAKPYTVTYDVNGGNSVAPTQANRTIGQIFSVATAPTKNGYEFEHWSDGRNNYNAGSDYQVGTSNVVLQAIWTAKVYQISYNFNGGTGTPISPQNYTFGSGPATLPASGPTRFEHNFVGWANSITATTGAFTYEPSGNIMLHAVWVTSVYRLTFNAGSGVSDTATATVTIGQSITLPGASRANYTLQGWSTSLSGGTLLLTADPYIPTTDAILHAQWVPQVFTVTYNGNSGTAGKASDSVAYNAATPIQLPSASRPNYVFKGWYSQASGGYLLGESGANYSPTGSIIAYAQWIQGSLSGMGPATLIAQITVRDGIDTGFTAGSNGSTATVAYTAGALPDGTVITAYLENSPDRVASLLQTAASPILSLIIAWVAPDGTVPDTAVGKPIVMTVKNSSITAGSKVFGLVGNQPDLLGVALVDGQVQVSITKDPAVVVAMVSPDAPTGVTANAINESSATVSWTASANNGGSAIIKYVATAGAGKSCESVTTSCVISGLATGTPYTFTVLANNAIGDSAASSPSSQLTLTAPGSGNNGGGTSGGGSSGGGSGGGGSGGGGSAPANPSQDVSTSATEAKAAAEKAAADAKAAAELKATQERAAAEKAAAEALKAAQEIADAQAKAAAELKAAQDKAAEELRIAAELKAAQEKADAELKAAAEKKALNDAKAAAALAAKKIVPKISLYSISSKLTLSAYDNAYLKKYISTLKSKAPVTCIGYYYTKNTTIAKAKARAATQAKAVCAMIKKAKPSVITSIALYPSTKAPLAAKGAKWVAVSYRVDSFNKK
jgi:uncharacterized repeat protein (TIGR02543 family)